VQFNLGSLRPATLCRTPPPGAFLALLYEQSEECPPSPPPGGRPGVRLGEGEDITGCFGLRWRAAARQRSPKHPLEKAPPPAGHNCARLGAGLGVGALPRQARHTTAEER